MVKHVKPGDRVTVNVETFCGECFFCKKGFVNNCTDRNGGCGALRQGADLALPDMYGKNLTFKTGGVDGCDCEETLKLIAEGKLDTERLITHTYPLSNIDEAYELFENKRDGVIKVAVKC